MLQWARENGCPWNEDTLAVAGEFGHLNVFQWALEHGCPWNSKRDAIEDYEKNILEWMNGHHVLSTYIKNDK